MSQHLVLPINDLIMTAGYKNEKYKAAYGWAHYGVDCVSGRGVKLVYACGDGEVVAAGMDGTTETGSASRLGNVVVIVYRDVKCADGVTRDLTARGYHFEVVKVKAGDRVTKNSVIGLYGNTGANTNGAHLHFEFDTDTKYPCLAAGVKSGGRIINRAEEVARVGSTVDSTVHPARVWYADYNQTMGARSLTSGWILAGDVKTAGVPKADKPSGGAEEQRKPFVVYGVLGRYETADAARAFAVAQEEKTIIMME